MIDPHAYPIQVDRDPPDFYGALRGFKKEEFEEACKFAVENSPTVLVIYSPQGGQINIHSGDIDLNE